jgi:hypothetical protein
MAPRYVTCPHCNEKRDLGGDYTSPANRQRDHDAWRTEHLSGQCLTAAAQPEPETDPEIQTFNALKDRLSQATGSPGMTAFHGGKVHMTLAEWERLIDTICEFRDAPRLTQEHVSRAFNDAANEVIDAAENDDRVTDAVNLVVNAGLHFIEHPGDDLEAAIERSYDEDADVVLDWIR